MNKLLIGIRPPKFLRYLFFIAYSWYRGYKSDREDAHVMATMLLGAFNGFMFYGLLIWYSSKALSMSKYQTVIPFFLFIGFIFYFLFLHKRKWKFYIEEFKHVKRKQQKIGLIYLFVYVLMCLLIALHPLLLEDVFGMDIIEKDIQPPAVTKKEYLRY